MISDARFVLTLLTALGCALMAGVFFAFSAFVMKALARLPPALGVKAMQAINVAAVKPLFLTVFLGTSAACAALFAWSLVGWARPGSWWLLAGGLVYLGGCFVVSVLFNVPRNDALAAVDAASPDAAELWADYVATWTAWNHVRTVAALLAAASFTLALG
jgi:uncharacterized membrane protein